MTLPTLVVCEAGKEKLQQIEALVSANPELDLVGSAGMNETFQKIRETNPRLVWIELTPDPDEGFKLLSGLKEEFPAVYCLVSNEDLDANLVKTSMQMGAVDFLDAKTWNDQFPDVISRIIMKETAQAEALERLEADRQMMREVLEQQKAAHPTTSKTNLSAMKKLVTDTKEIESRATMNFALLVVVVVLLAVGAFFVFKAH